MPKDMSTVYKARYDYPNVHGVFICTKCNKVGELPANYCMSCGKELEDKQKQGLMK